MVGGSTGGEGDRGWLEGDGKLHGTVNNNIQRRTGRAVQQCVDGATCMGRRRGKDTHLLNKMHLKNICFL